jgi:hypothetical protein
MDTLGLDEIGAVKNRRTPGMNFTLLFKINEEANLSERPQSGPVIVSMKNDLHCGLRVPFTTKNKTNTPATHLDLCYSGGPEGRIRGHIPE